MPTPLLLDLIPGTLPAGTCFSTEQDRLNTYMGISHALLPAGTTFINIGTTKPPVDLQGYPWLKTDEMRIYEFVGQWRSPIPDYSTFERRLFIGSTTDLITYDGGSAGAASTVSGPTWEVDTDFTGRSPIGPGAIPTSTPATTLSVGDTYGEGAHVLTQPELPDLTLSFNAFVGDSSAGGGYVTVPHDTDTFNKTFDINPSPLGDATAHNTIHPVKAIYIIKRTVRTYYIVP